MISDSTASMQPIAYVSIHNTKSNYQYVHNSSHTAAFVEVDDLLREYYEVWKFIGTELDVDRNVMNTIEEDHSSDRDRLHALVEVWLNGAQLTGTRQQDLNKALQSQCVVRAMTGMSTCMSMDC